MPATAEEVGLVIDLLVFAEDQLHLAARDLAALDRELTADEELELVADLGALKQELAQIRRFLGSA